MNPRETVIHVEQGIYRSVLSTLFIIKKTEIIGLFIKYRMNKYTVVYPFKGVQKKNENT